MKFKICVSGKTVYAIRTITNISPGGRPEVEKFTSTLTPEFNVANASYFFLLK